MAASGAPNLLSAGHRLGRYEVLAKLAAGGMAVVYVGRAQGVAGFERLVALKVLHSNYAHEEEFIRMFLDEARLAARIRHPNVVPTIDISDSPENGFFLVMEYIEGDHLGALLSNAHKAEQRLPVPVVLRVICDVLAGLGAAHDLRDESGKLLNIVHRDVSPHNIMVGRDGITRLTDFGVAKAEDRLSHTRDGQVKGKLSYMAPEQASSGTTDARSDLFSVGIILWECLTGRRLFRAETTGATLQRLLHGEIAPPSTIDPSLADLDPVIRRALDRDPARRFQTADEFAEALEAVRGLASLRSVSKIVKIHAAPKIKRDKQLIEDAKRVLRGYEGTEGFEGDGLSEPSLPSMTSGLSAVSVSMSKVSGIYTNATATGVAPGPTGGLPAPQRLVTTPPPSHATADPPAEAGSDPFARPHRAASAGLRLSMLVVLLLGLVVAWLATTGPAHDGVYSEPLAAEPAQPGASQPAAQQPPAEEPLPERTTGDMEPAASDVLEATTASELAPTPAQVTPEATSEASPAPERREASTRRHVRSRNAKARKRSIRSRAAPRPTSDQRGASKRRSQSRKPKPTIDVPLANPYTN